MQRLADALVAAILVCVCLGAVRASAEARLALVIGNGSYSEVAPLENPTNDAMLIADALQAAGFDVTLVNDAAQDEFVRAISDFGRRLRNAGDDATGLFYYAGHGVQSFGRNYLLPVDVSLSDAADLSLVGVPAEAVLRQMFSARNQTNIVILDACRDNPFAAIPDLNDNGLAEMKAPVGTYLAYSTAPGEVAMDGEGANSPFTGALAARLLSPGIPIEALFRQVRVDVRDATGGLQTPWDSSSLTVDFQFVPAEAPSPEEMQMLQLWNSVRMSRDPLQVLLFLRGNPDSSFTEEARALLTELMEQELAAAAPAPQAEVARPEPVDPAAAERAAIEEARAAGTAAAYEAYLGLYPDGAFAELARLELQTIVEGERRTDPVSEPPQPAAVPQPELPSAEVADTVVFAGPIGMGDPQIAMRSLEELITGMPLFAPIEGLPDEVWKDKTCSTCHQWERTNLCEQAQTYLGNRTRAVSKQHPYGGVFKQALSIWARDGCN